MPSYIIRSIDPELWRHVKRRTTKRGWLLSWLFRTLLECYADGDLDAILLSRTIPDEFREKARE